MPHQTSVASFYVHIDSSFIPSLNEKTKCLESILSLESLASIIVEVEVDFEYSVGCLGNYESPPEPPSADYRRITVTDISFDTDKQTEDNIKALMTNKQKEATTYLAESIIKDNWSETYEEEALISIPSADDYNPHDDYDYCDDYRNL
jgi:hypothetical protein